MADEDPKNTETKDLPSVDDLLKSSKDAPPLVVTPEDEGADIHPGDVDRMLAEEDPEFAKKIKELQNSEFSTNVAIEAVDIEAFLKEGENLNAKKSAVRKLKFKDRVVLRYKNTHAGISKAIDDTQNFFINSVKLTGKLLVSGLQKIFKYSFGAIGKFLSWLIHLPARIKLLSLSVLVLAAASGLSLYFALIRGHFLPTLNRQYLTGFAEHADESFEYKESDSKESFDSEIRHPEHMYEVERIIVNLKQKHEGDHVPMGLFEFYIATNSQDATVEIGDRRTETRHIIQRVIEQMTYEELTSPQGKAKMKFILRKELNDFLTKSHHVRQVYIKTFVLKP